MTFDPTILGRDRELAALSELLGDPGAAARRRARRAGDRQIGAAGRRPRARARRGLPTAGVESEAHLPSRGCISCCGRSSTAPRAARAAARGAAARRFGLRRGGRRALPDRARRADLLAEAAAERARSCWSSRTRTGSTAPPRGAGVRRAAARPSRRCCWPPRATARPPLARRAGGAAPRRLDARRPALLDARAPGSPRGARAGARRGAGNPLALVELPIARAAPAGGALPAWLPLTARLERAFAARAPSCPTPRACCCSGGARRRRRARRGPRGGGAVAGAQPVLEDLSRRSGGWSTSTAPVRFRHPLIRSAVVQAASVAQRPRPTRRWRGARGQPDRRVWHRAARSSAPDEEVAAELEAGRRAQQRGGGRAAVGRWSGRRGSPAIRRRGRSPLAPPSSRSNSADATSRAAARRGGAAARPADRARLAWIRES